MNRYNMQEARQGTALKIIRKIDALLKRKEDVSLIDIIYVMKAGKLIGSRDYWNDNTYKIFAEMGRVLKLRRVNIISFNKMLDNYFQELVKLKNKKHMIVCKQMAEVRQVLEYLLDLQKACLSYKK